MKTIKNLLISSLLACTLLSACKEKEETPPKETYSLDPRDRFVGTYRVTDDTGVVYIMTMSKNAGTGRYLRIENLGNMFDAVSVPYNFDLNPDSLLFNTNNRIFIPPFGPIKDKQNRTWDMFFGDQLTGNGYEENYLYGNTIVLYFELSNLPYYDHEGVPFHMQFHKHIATKIN